MNKADWKNQYINTLVKAGLSQEEAEINYMCGIDSFDFNDSPEDAANDELYYYETDN